MKATGQKPSVETEDPKSVDAPWKTSGSSRKWIAKT